jgi:RNA polymerase-binding transcription factor DksA
MFDNDRRRVRLFERLRSMRIGSLRRAIRGLVRGYAEEIKVPDDLIRESPAREVEMALLEMEGRESRDLEEALRWLARGRFGECQDCGTRISAVRLRAVPFATRCRDCQEEAEQESGRAERERWGPLFGRVVTQ